MTILPPHHSAYRRDLGEGLMVRWSTSSDAERLAALIGHVFRQKPDDPPARQIMAWASDLLSGRHPLITPNDWALVEDTRAGRIVACTCLLRQSWSYDGIEFPIGRPELVATHENYRQRGLIRAIFELIHARSEARGDFVQGITGIPFYYRLFGYEYALELEGSHKLRLDQIPDKLADPLFTLRPATPGDLPLLMALYEREHRWRFTNGPYLVKTVVELEYWQFLLNGGISTAAGEGWHTQLIIDPSGKPCGYVLTRPKPRWSDSRSLPIVGLVLVAGYPYAGALPSIVQGLAAQARAMPRQPDDPPVNGLLFLLSTQHPVYDALEGQLVLHRRPYAWFVRVPDLIRLLQRIAPVLEDRLLNSCMAGWSGDLNLYFYPRGVRLRFEAGRLHEILPWQRGIWEVADQGQFPPHVFWQLLFGYRSLKELQHTFPDAFAGATSSLLLQILFPERPSFALPLD